MTRTHTETPRRFSPMVTFLRLTTGWMAMAAEIRNRRAISTTLGKLSPLHLRDIGLTQSDVEAACAKPLSQDASTELYIKTQLRSANW